ncbi:MAG: UDP-N-acetylmuramate--L-alanine ligase [Coriobacteriaceae bacterium]|nr:UDP-N-acetylmuramate--L-alanine ligase [Coriobacteriaceae bacterium]
MSTIAVPEATTAPTFKRAHFIGVGGAGMSGIALVLHERGFTVTGSDLKTSRYVRQLTRAGVAVHVGHEASTIDEVSPDVVVVSTAIPETNPELMRARELGIPVWHRAKMLSALGYGRTTVAAAGTHGKTTTSSMVATMLDRMGLDPSFLIGGIVEGYGTNGKNGDGEHFVVEADESDSSFLYLSPHVVIVTNVEADHMDHYSSLEEIEDTFCAFMGLVGEDGTVIVCGEDPRLVELARSTGRTVLTYGEGEGFDITCTPVASSRAHVFGTDFTVALPNGCEIPVSIKNNPGRHNMLNATAALGAAFALGLDTARAGEALSTFEGARRRFTQVGEVRGVSIVDDYGHHPTEVKATLAAAKQLDFERVAVVFQPHRYTRLQALCDDFVEAFADADTVVLIDVFPAGEMPIPGVTSKMLADKIAAAHPEKVVRYVADHPALMACLDEVVASGDLLITMGAGDVTTVGPEYLEHAASEDR